jgi:hypothetical protein
VKRGENQQLFASPEEALDYLKHYGVKGQKWGVRKEDDSAGLGRISQPPGSGLGSTVNEAEYHRLASGIAKQAGMVLRRCRPKSKHNIRLIEKN